MIHPGLSFDAFEVLQSDCKKLLALLNLILNKYTLVKEPSSYNEL